jgi:FixJ family two-component response regulator
MEKRQPLIAVVDDDKSVCRAMKRLVRALGMKSETFASGQEFVDCLEAMPSFRPDCAILDVQMPGLNGLAVQEWLARRARPIPVIFVTAHDDVGVRERALVPLVNRLPVRHSYQSFEWKLKRFVRMEPSEM